MNNEEFLRVLAESTKIKTPPRFEDSHADTFNKQFDYDKAFNAEVNDNDRLIALDFRTVGMPPFEEWVTDNRSFRKGRHQKDDIGYDYFCFDWSLVNDHLFVTIKITILDNHYYIQDVFRSHTAEVAPSLSPAQMSHFWKPCKKNIGTTCMRTAITTFFAYKNAVVKVRAVPILPENNPLRDILSDWTNDTLVPKSLNGDPWDMLIAEWIYNILQTAPCFKVFPAEPKSGY